MTVAIAFFLLSSLSLSAEELSNESFTFHYGNKLLNKSAESFCGERKWIRKFADGTNCWADRSRVNVDITQFRCLNYSSEIIFKAPDHVSPHNYEIDWEKLCLAPADQGCIQDEILRSQGYEIISPRSFDSSGFTATLSTKPLGYPDTFLGIELNKDVPFAPSAFRNLMPMALSDILEENRFFIPDGALSTGLSFFLPAYIGYVSDQDSSDSGGLNNLNSVEIVYALGEKEIYRSKPTLSHICPVYYNPEIDLGQNEWCVRVMPPYFGDVFHLRALSRESLDLIDDGIFNQSAQWDYAYVKLNYNVQNRDLYINSNYNSTPKQSGMKPGNDLYYLKSLGLLELSGIPGLKRPILWCNTNRSISMSNPVTSGEVFSEDEFRCCISAGKATENSSKCCSGFAVSENGREICKLPPSTNLNVYFNSLVSSEGINAKMPNEYFTENDFNKETGELVISEAIDSKLVSLGEKLCSSGNIRKGAAFGNFYAEPNNGYYRQRGDFENSLRFSIVDSSADNDVDGNSGVFHFNRGYRWNHHTYCDD